MRRFILIGAILIALQLIAYQSSEAQNFSVEIGSGDTMMPVPGFPPGDDILAPGPFPVLPGGSPLGPIDVDAFTYGRHSVFGQPIAIDFSVDAFSVGAAGSAVLIESTVAFGEQNYDVYRSFLTGTNFQIHDGDGSGVGGGGTTSPLGMFEPQIAGPVGSGVDGYDSRPGPPMPGVGPIYWSWEPGSGGVPGSASPADILISPTLPGYPSMAAAPPAYATEASLGLFAGDNLDALEVYDIGVLGIFDAGDVVLFSLDPLSFGGLAAYGATPGDIIVLPFGAPAFIIPEMALGLAAGDNLTAISVVPEPNSALIILVALGAAGLRRRKRI